EEDDLTESLAADLEPDVHLCHGHIADVDPLPKHPAFAVRTADDETALADAGEDGIAVAFLKECSAGSGFLEDLDGFAVVVRPARRAATQPHSTSHKRKIPPHHRSPHYQAPRLPNPARACDPNYHISRICAALDSTPGSAAPAAAPAAGSAAAEAPMRNRTRKSTWLYLRSPG